MGRIYRAVDLAITVRWVWP